MRADHESPYLRLFASEEMSPAPRLRRLPGFPTSDRQWKTTALDVRQRPPDRPVYCSVAAAEVRRQIAWKAKRRIRLFFECRSPAIYSNPHIYRARKYPASFLDALNTKTVERERL